MVKRICLLQTIYSFDVEGTGGGIARFVIALSHELNKERFDVAICGLWDTGTDNEHRRIHELNDMGLKAFTAAEWKATQPMRSLIKSYQYLVGFIKNNPMDIIHSHSEFSDVVALMLKVHPGVPVIARTLHNGYPIEWRKRALRRMILTNTLYPTFYDAEIGVARHVVDNLDHRWLSRRLRRNAFLLHNAIDVRRFSEPSHLPNKTTLGLSLPRNAFVIGTVGRLREEKGYEYLLDAASMVINQVDQPVYFIIIGAGDRSEALIEQAKNLHIDQRVIFTGPREDVEFLLSGMDLFICSSLWEGFSTAMLEAMAAGVPVVATDIPGNRELITPDVTGWMVAPRDGKALANKIIDVIDSPAQKLQEITREASKVPSEYSIATVARQHEQYYQRLLEEKK